MFLDEELSQLKDRISQMSDQQLVRIVEVESGDYRKEAVEFAEAELQKRNVPFEKPKPAVSQTEEAEPTPQPGRRMRCPNCSSWMRAAILFADKELTMVFTDNNEERFVQAFGCTACGEVRLALDLETDVVD